jgi:ribosomal protein S18 acetylase RimI-like enzyme
VRFHRIARRFLRAITGVSRPQMFSPPMTIDNLTLREATLADLEPLADLHVRTFNETHVGPFGSGPTLATRVWQWREKLSELDATHFLLVLETPTKQLVGFIWCHPADDDPKWAARLNKIYLLRGYQRRGLGTRLIAAAVDRLLAHGLTSMMLFTEPDNEPACNFYDGLGGQRQMDDKGDFGGMYGWPDLRQLQAKIAARSGPS